jgi:thymidylate kinase
MSSASDDELIARIPEDMREPNGIPSEEVRVQRRRAYALARQWLDEGSEIQVSPLGAEWSRDLDVVVEALPTEKLTEAGFLPVTGLLSRVGVHGGTRWAVVDNGQIIGAIDLARHRQDDPVSAVLRRCSDRGSVGMREVLELRALVRAGHSLPDTEVVRVASGIEGAYGGSVLRQWHRGNAPRPPVSVPRRVRARIGAIRARSRPRVIVALSGVDGSGKSSLAKSLGGQLSCAGVPTGTVWTRPGMGPRLIGRLAAAGKRLMRQDAAPGVRAVAAGDTPILRSRKGVIGWVWTSFVTMSFLFDVRKQLRQVHGVVIFDRHVLDALATLEFVYQGVDLRFARLLVRRLLPRAAITAYLDLPAEVAVARKPGDTFGLYAVEQQLDAYRVELHSRPDVIMIDAARPTADIAYQLLKALTT